MEPNKAGSLVNIPKEAENIFRNYNKNMSNAQWAMRFAASQKNVFMVLSGMNQMCQVEENTDIMDNFTPLSEEEYSLIKKVSKIIDESVAIACTKCRYCTEKCPQGIPIPEYFATFNSYYMTKNMGNAGMYYRRYANNALPASACVKCGNCVPSCPQHLDIPKLLEDTAALFEV